MNHINLTLDTTPPEIEIFVQNYTTRDTLNTIIIQSNETLDTYQNIYAIDNNGIRHNYTFDYNGDYFYGEITFSDFPYGVTTLYTQVKDVVWNQSQLISKSINLVESTDLLSMETELFTNEMENYMYVPIIKNDLYIPDIEIGVSG